MHLAILAYTVDDNLFTFWITHMSSSEPIMQTTDRDNIEVTMPTSPVMNETASNIFTHYSLTNIT